VFAYMLERGDIEALHRTIERKEAASQGAPGEKRHGNGATDRVAHPAVGVHLRASL
jgi:hypothetical protein